MASRENKNTGASAVQLLGICAGVLCIVVMLGFSAATDTPWEHGLAENLQENEAGATTNSDIVPAPPGDYGDMVRLPDETYIIGLTDEDPYGAQAAGRREITVSAFYIDRFEVTNAEYREFVSEQGEQYAPRVEAWGSSASAESQMENYFYSSSRGNYPVVGITWDDAKAFCEWNGRRLPTEAEWEYAARSGRTGAIYPWRGISTSDPRGRYLANFAPSEGRARTGYAFTAPVGSYPPSRWGIHDIAGNVAEWVEDAYTPTYDDFPVTTETPVVRADSSNNRRVVRGGSWASSGFEIGVGVRDYAQKDEASTQIGIRCAADPIQVESSGNVGPGAMDVVPPAESGNEPALDNEEETGDENSPMPPDEEPVFPDPSEENGSEESEEGSENEPPQQ
jgi:formylglycine-generating enzyme required for sulfatase activity